MLGPVALRPREGEAELLLLSEELSEELLEEAARDSTVELPDS